MVIEGFGVLFWDCELPRFFFGLYSPQVFFTGLLSAESSFLYWWIREIAVWGCEPFDLGVVGGRPSFTQVFRFDQPNLRVRLRLESLPALQLKGVLRQCVTRPMSYFASCDLFRIAIGYVLTGLS